MRSRLPLFILASIPILYVGNTITGFRDLSGLVEVVRKIDADRAGSLQTRLSNESQLVRRALQRPILGWGGWGRHRVLDDEGRDISITDEAWLVILGKFGFVGLLSFLASFSLPVALLIRRIPPSAWPSPQLSASAGLLTMVSLHMIDYCLNGSINPLFILVGGGIASLAQRYAGGWQVATRLATSAVGRPTSRESPKEDLPSIVITESRWRLANCAS
jgi:hypothetical protein